MEGPIWTTYKPADADILKTTLLSEHKLRAALDYLCRSAKNSMQIDMENPFEMLFVADEVMGMPEFLDNKHLGRLLHIRNFIITRLWDQRNCVRMVRRWDKRMIEALPKSHE